MPDYAKLYRLLFNAITDALERIETGDIHTASSILICAQQTTEELYISESEQTACKNSTDFGCIF